MCSIDRNEKNDVTGDFIANIIRLTANKIVFCVKKSLYAHESERRLNK